MRTLVVVYVATNASNEHRADGEGSLSVTAIATQHGSDQSDGQRLARANDPPLGLRALPLSGQNDRV